MDMKEIEALIALAKREGVGQLKYETKDVKISVTLPLAMGHTSVSLPPYGHSMGTGLPYQDISRTPPSSKTKEDAGFHKITSPFVGTFYTSPSPGENAYVKVGDRIKKGQILCIVEAMKIMNEIDSDVAGEIVELCVENESLVEYGQVLFLIKV